MRAIQRTLLHFAAYFALALSLYPILALVFTLSGLSSSNIWLAEGFLVLTAAAALVHAVLVRYQYRRKPRLVNTSFFAAGILFGVMAFFLTPLSGSFMGMLSAIAVFAVYQAGVRLFFVEYDVLTHVYVYTGVCMAFILPSAALWFFDHGTSFLWQILLFLMVSAVFGIARNFSGIDIALQSQGDEDAPLPQGLLRYNRLLLCILGAAVLLLVLLRRQIGAMLWTLVKMVVHYLGKALLFFAGLFTGEKQGGTDAPSQPLIIEQTATAQNAWVTLLCTAILAGLLFFLLVRYRERIAAAIVSFLRTVRDCIARLFGRSYETVHRFEQGGFVDHRFDLPVQEMVFTQEMPQHAGQSLRRLLRRYRRMKKSVEKYRLGYGILLARLSENGMAVHTSDSAREVLAQIPGEHPQRALWEIVTEDYERVRYREEIPQSAAFSALEQLLLEKTA